MDPFMMNPFPPILIERLALSAEFLCQENIGNLIEGAGFVKGSYLFSFLLSTAVKWN
jgi:hypothetical protein